MACVGAGLGWGGVEAERVKCLQGFKGIFFLDTAEYVFTKKQEKRKPLSVVAGAQSLSGPAFDDRQFCALASISGDEQQRSCPPAWGAKKGQEPAKPVLVFPLACRTHFCVLFLLLCLRGSPASDVRLRSHISSLQYNVCLTQNQLLAAIYEMFSVPFLSKVLSVRVCDFWVSFNEVLRQFLV